MMKNRKAKVSSFVFESNEVMSEFTLLGTEWHNGEGFRLEYKTEDEDLNFKQDFYSWDFEKIIAALIYNGLITLEEIQENVEKLKTYENQKS